VAHKREGKRRIKQELRRSLAKMTEDRCKKSERKGARKTRIMAPRPSPFVVPWASVLEGQFRGRNRAGEGRVLSCRVLHGDLKKTVDPSQKNGTPPRGNLA